MPSRGFNRMERCLLKGNLNANGWEVLEPACLGILFEYMLLQLICGPLVADMWLTCG